jgi:hypothetical protein
MSIARQQALMQSVSLQTCTPRHKAQPLLCQLHQVHTRITSTPLAMRQYQ